MGVYSALSLLAVRYIYISTLGFLLVMPVQKGLKVWLTCGMCVARAIPCMGGLNLSKKQLTYYFINRSFFVIPIVVLERMLSF